MPFKLPHQDRHNQLFYIGKCDEDPEMARYVIISSRGCFTLNEAIPFLHYSKNQGAVPYYGSFFANTVYLASRFMDIYLPMKDDEYLKIKYYISEYSRPRLLSQYEWNIARHDVHQFVEPKTRSRRVFGDYMTTEEQIEAMRENDVVQVIRTASHPVGCSQD